MKTLILSTLFIFSASISCADAALLFQESFDGAYTPFSDSAQIAVTSIGSGDLGGFSVGTSSAGTNALALTGGNDNFQRTETVAEIDVSGEDLNDLLLQFSIAADPNDFENTQIDNLPNSSGRFCCNRGDIYSRCSD